MFSLFILHSFWACNFLETFILGMPYMCIPDHAETFLSLATMTRKVFTDMRLMGIIAISCY